MDGMGGGGRIPRVAAAGPVMAAVQGGEFARQAQRQRLLDMMQQVKMREDMAFRQAVEDRKNSIAQATLANQREQLAETRRGNDIRERAAGPQNEKNRLESRQAAVAALMGPGWDAWKNGVGSTGSTAATAVAPIHNAANENASFMVDNGLTQNDPKNPSDPRNMLKDAAVAAASANESDRKFAEKLAANRKMGGGRPQVRTLEDGTIVVIDPDTNTGSPVTGPDGNPLQARDTQLESGTQKFGKDLEFIAKMPADLALLESYVGKDQPGKGPLAGHLPNWMLTQEGVKVRQSAVRLLNALIYMSTGKQINEAETARQLEARGLGDTATRQQFDAGVTQLKDELKRASVNWRARYSPRVVEEYRKRGGLSDGLEEFFPPPSSPPPTASAYGSTDNLGVVPIPPPIGRGPATSRVRRYNPTTGRVE